MTDTTLRRSLEEGSAAPEPVAVSEPIAMQPLPQKMKPTPKVTDLHALNETVQWVDCPHCNKRTQTRVEKQGEGTQLIIGVMLCMVCVCLSCLPCWLGWFEETHWFCKGCGKQLAYNKHPTDTSHSRDGFHVCPVARDVKDVTEPPPVLVSPATPAVAVQDAKS